MERSSMKRRRGARRRSMHGKKRTLAAGGTWILGTLPRRSRRPFPRPLSRRARFRQNPAAWPSLEATGVTVTSEGARSLDVPPHGEARAEWTISADREGTAKLRVSGRSANEGDAMEKSFIVYEHGIDKLVARSGKIRGSEAII